MGVIGTFAPEDMISGKFPIVDGVKVIPSGTSPFRRGTILAASGAPLASGGTPDCIALEDVDASAAETRCVVALSGGFNANFLFTGDGSDPAAYADSLRAKNIYLTKGLIDGAAATWAIAYVLNGGTNGAGNPATYTAADLPLSLGAPSKASSTFAGWYTDAGFSTEVNQIPAGVEGDVTVYAKFV
jgi:uncharacterized repeat protein (TIGR02543 family)